MLYLCSDGVTHLRLVGCARSRLPHASMQTGGSGNASARYSTSETPVLILSCQDTGRISSWLVFPGTPPLYTTIIGCQARGYLRNHSSSFFRRLKKKLSIQNGAAGSVSVCGPEDRWIEPDRGTFFLLDATNEISQIP